MENGIIRCIETTMAPKEVLLELLANERWSFDGDALVWRDREGGHISLATVQTFQDGYPVVITFIDDLLPEVSARSEKVLRDVWADLSRISSFRSQFNRPQE